MADKTYKMLVTLSNGSTIDAGTFVAPQGPKGDTGTVPEALSQEASALKSGNLPTSGWNTTPKTLYDGKITYGRYGSGGRIYENFLPPFEYSAHAALSDWQGTKLCGLSITNVSALEGGVKLAVRISGNDYYVLRIFNTGTVNAWTYNDLDENDTAQIKVTFLSDWLYTISDTSITANSDVLMELTDDGGVKSYSMEAGKMTVIRGTVPTVAIPYTYKVKQTNASGQFTLVNHFVPNIPVTSVNGQTGAVTIAVPTKTSELENDSGYVNNLPIVQNVVCNDVDSATTLDTTITCEVGDLILAQIIVRSALTLPTGWTLLKTIPAVETTYNQTLSFAYKRATSTSETLTVTQATAGRIYTNLVRLSNAASISYIQSCEKTNTGAVSISSTKPVTPNMVVWGASSTLWVTTTPYGDWSSSPSTLDYYSLPQTTKQPRLGTFIDSSGAGERTFTAPMSNANGNGIMCGAVEIVGDEVARKGDIPSAGEWITVTENSATLTEAGTYQVLFGENYGVQSIIYWDGSTGANGIPSTTASVTNGTAIIAERYLTVAANGVLSTHITMITVKDGSWTQTTPSFSGFKYRKIN